MTPNWTTIKRFDDQGNFAIQTEGCDAWKCSKIDNVTHDDLETLERYLKDQLRQVAIARAFVDLEELARLKSRRSVSLPFGKQSLEIQVR